MNNQPSTILKLQDENLNIEIVGLKNKNGNWIFSFRRDTNTLDEYNNKGDPSSDSMLYEEIRWLLSFKQVMTILNQYRWRSMNLISIHSDYKVILQKEFEQSESHSVKKRNQCQNNSWNKLYQ